MVCKSTKKYIENKAGKDKIVIPDNYENILNQYCIAVANFGYTLEFREGRNLTKSKLNANAGLFKNSSIVVTPEWAAQLVLYNTEEVHNAFKMTIGHELTHKDKDICVLRYGIRYIKFIAYINEVHADFGAAQKMANSNRDTLLKSLRYKKSFTDVEKDDPTHPTWEKRISYVENFDFNKDLIQQIAKDVGCTNKNLIDKVCNHYQEITLN